VSEFLFFLITALLLSALRGISRISFKSSACLFIYVVLVIGFIGGNYYSIFINGTLLMDIFPNLSFEENEVIRWLSIIICLFLGLLTPKRQ
jgi:preprotein translocase subunit SecF